MATHQARPKPADGKMVITNEHAFDETTASDLTNAASKPLEAQEEMSEVPEQVVVHKQPSPTQTEKSQVDVKVEDKTPLLSMIKDYEDGKSGGESKSAVKQIFLEISGFCVCSCQCCAFAMKAQHGRVLLCFSLMGQYARVTSVSVW